DEQRVRFYVAVLACQNIDAPSVLPDEVTQRQAGSHVDAIAVVAVERDNVVYKGDSAPGQGDTGPMAERCGPIHAAPAFCDGVVGDDNLRAFAAQSRAVSVISANGLVAGEQVVRDP